MSELPQAATHVKLVHAEYRVLALLRNSMHVNDEPRSVIESLRRKGLLKPYDLEVTDKGHALMQAYSDGDLKL